MKKGLAFWLSALTAAGAGICLAATGSAAQDLSQPSMSQSRGNQNVITRSSGSPSATQQASHPLDVRQLARAVDDHYNHLRSLESDFTEIYRGEGAEREESGTLWLKKPRKMRWEYRSPRGKLFVSDGQSVWFYLPAERQLRKTGLRQLDDVRSPIAFLLGKTKLENELQGLSQAVDQSPMTPGDIVLRGVPKAMADQVSEVQLEITPAHQIARIVLLDQGGGSTEFRFSGWKENLNLADSQFHFVAPAGVETVEGAFAP
ncbi:MAG: outer membrane lipoprotein carrier protein LolA [Terriglobales bacterium]